MTTKFLTGVLIYSVLTIIVLGICGIWPLLILGAIDGVLLHILVTKDMTKEEITEAMGANWLEKKFSSNPLFKDLTKDE
jgi:hypothetical protein